MIVFLKKWPILYIMKKGFGVLLATLPLLLTACSSQYDSFYVPFNLDYQTNISETYSPTNISPKNLRMMFETKQSFALYFYSDNCIACKNSTSLLNNFLQIKNNQIEFYKLSASNLLLDLRDEKHLEPFKYMFESTPQIHFFYNGQLTLTMPSNKYTSGYPVFESTLNSILKRSPIYTTTTLEGYSYFLENNLTDYLIYLRTSEDMNGDSYTSYSYQTYKNVVYDKMSQAENSTLIIDIDKAKGELLDRLESEYNLKNYNTSNLAIYKYTDGLDLLNSTNGVISYDTEEGLSELINIIDTKLYKNEI